MRRLLDLLLLSADLHQALGTGDMTVFPHISPWLSVGRKRGFLGDRAAGD